ncbi:MAG: hypothetical protein QOC94_4296 [Actinoplanes sp.]|jgi:hypothetical protein|nr:hypothetical protein [Actinoplanes sp.]
MMVSMVRLFVLLAAVQLVLVVLALISALSAERVRAMPRALWVFLILVIPLLGAIFYFVWGRPVAPPHEQSVWRSGKRRAAPDDDLDFLRNVDTEKSRRERELLAQWERELQQRSDED